MEVLLNQDDHHLDVEDMVEQAYTDLDRQCEILSAYAVDDSFRDPEVWYTLFATESKISDLYREFTTEGDGEGMMRQLKRLERMTGATS